MPTTNLMMPNTNLIELPFQRSRDYMMRNLPVLPEDTSSDSNADSNSDSSNVSTFVHPGRLPWLVHPESRNLSW